MPKSFKCFSYEASHFSAFKENSEIPSSRSRGHTPRQGSREGLVLEKGVLAFVRPCAFHATMVPSSIELQQLGRSATQSRTWGVTTCIQSMAHYSWNQPNHLSNIRRVPELTQLISQRSHRLTSEATCFALSSARLEGGTVMFIFLRIRRTSNRTTSILARARRLF